MAGSLRVESPVSKRAAESQQVAGTEGSDLVCIQEHSNPTIWTNPEAMDYRSIITIDPAKRGGKPCIRGLRITVYDVLDYLASGMSEAEILCDFPDLTSEDIRTCLAFAADRERRLAASS